MRNPNHLPIGQRPLTLRELLLSMALIGAGMGVFRLIVWLIHTASPPSANPDGVTILVYFTAMFLVGSGAAILAGRLVFASEIRLGMLTLIGGLTGVAVGLYWPTLLAEIST